MTKTNANIPDVVFRVWRARERVELEASHHFAHLARALSALYGRQDRLAKVATQAANDEERHAELVRTIIRHSELLRHVPPRNTVLGPPKISRYDRVIYASAALSCVTETLSTALLVEMQKQAEPGLIRQTVHEILEDEVLHSRLGWAVLARAADEGDISWLAKYIPAMIEEAVATDTPTLSPSEALLDLSGWGILSPGCAQGLILRAIEQVILPGFDHLGIKTAR